MLVSSTLVKYSTLISSALEKHKTVVHGAFIYNCSQETAFETRAGNHLGDRSFQRSGVAAHREGAVAVQRPVIFLGHQHVQQMASATPGPAIVKTA